MTRRLLLAVLTPLLLLLAACDPHDVQVAVHAAAPLTAPLEPPTRTYSVQEIAYFQALEWQAAALRWQAAEQKYFADVEAAVPHELKVIRWCEAGSYLDLPYLSTNYAAYTHGYTGASGGYQILRSTWHSWRVHVPVAMQYDIAQHAPPHVQSLVATWAYDHDPLGKGHWNASRYCWG